MGITPNETIRIIPVANVTLHCFGWTGNHEALEYLGWMYYNVNMVRYELTVRKAITKGDIPKDIVKNIHNAFISLDTTKDLNLFDIKKLKGNYKRDYYRLRKGKYRAIFYLEEGDIFVIHMGKREEVYDLWE